MRFANKILTSVQFCSLLYLMCLTLLEVQIRCGGVDLILAKSIFIFGLGCFILLLINCKNWKWSWIDSSCSLWFLYFILRVWIGNEYPCGPLILHILWTFILYWVLRLLFYNRNQFIIELIPLLILLFGAIESVWGLFQLINAESDMSVFLLKGNFMNPGPYSAYPMMGAVAGICMLEYNSIDKFNLSSRLSRYCQFGLNTLTLLCIVILPITFSRAAWVGTGIVIVYVYREFFKRYKWSILFLIAVSSTLLIIVKLGSVEARLIIWASSLLSWSHNPFLGVGCGGFNHACAEGLSYFYDHFPSLHSMFFYAGVTNSSFNTIFQILVEQGLVGVALCITFVFFALRGLSKLSKPLFLSVISLLIFSCFSYPFEMLPYRIIFTLSVSLAASNNIIKTPVIQKKLFPVLLLFSILVLSVPLIETTELMSQAEKDASDLIKRNDPFYLQDMWELLPQNQDNPVFLFTIAKLLENKGRLLDSNAILRKGAKVSADPMFFVLQGNNYMRMGNDNMAETMYQKAFSVMPNRHYPLYKLLLLYQETRQIDKASNVAMKIVSMRPKVKSNVTDEIQQTAQEFLDSLNNNTYSYE